ncbi:MAG: c-type cytochrome, partial [Deltaproteobacteria bacterium]|nr:c-type cytochrome [Deltaproteobacteria bacterium]
MARRELNLDEEKRSYAGVWLVAAILLVVGAVWSLLDDTFFRRPWKAYQTEFFRIEEEKERAALEAEEGKLGSDAKYQELQGKLAEAQKSLGSGESAKQLAAATQKLEAATMSEQEADIQVRFVKSELEEAWYHYDHAIEAGGNVDAARKRRDELAVEKNRLESEWKATQAVVAKLQAEIDELRAPIVTLDKQMKEVGEERDRIANKIDGMKSMFGPVAVSRIPAIGQVVLPDFDINNFEEPVARVDRCVSCHAGIDKAGFEELANPYKTHPKRDPLLVKHPTEKFGCTPCHEGQGVAVNTIEQAHGEVKFWEHPLLAGDEQQSRCLNCHLDVSLIPDAAKIRQGEYLFEQLGCHGCHLVGGYEELQPVGPNLERIAAKVDPQWMVSWIQNPFEFRPRTKMPNFLLTEEQSKAVAAYLWTSSKADGDAWLAAHPDPGGISPGDAALVEKGKGLFDEVGCRACHAIAADEIATPLGAAKDWGPNLGNVAQKESGRFIYWWIKDPRGWNPKSRMPDLRLTDDEARAITSYLLSLSTPPPADQAVTPAVLEDAELAEEGKAIVRKYGCYGCHVINGMESESRIGVELSTFGAKPIEELFFGNNPHMPRTWNVWTEGKLRNPRVYETEHVEQLMPNFQLADEDIVALRVWLQSRVERIPPRKFRDPENEPRLQQVREGRWVIEQYNCMGCHVINDQGGFIRRLYTDNPAGAPPILNGEGEKVQPQWFYGFLQDPARQPLRFWLKVRMPTFHLSRDETTKVVNYFKAVAELPNPYFFWDSRQDSSPDLLKAGETLMSDQYFACWACHVRGSQTPEGPMEQWAPNLAYARERLNPQWILAWIKDPNALMPGTKMPSFYPGGPDDVFEGNEDKQILAMRDYIMSIGGHGGSASGMTKDAPAAAPAAQAAAAPAPAGS